MEASENLERALEQAAIAVAQKAEQSADEGNPGGSQTYANAAKALSEAYAAIQRPSRSRTAGGRGRGAPKAGGRARGAPKTAR